MKYSVKTNSPVVLLFPIVAIIAAYALPLRNWVQVALAGIAIGAVASVAAKGLVQRSFEPADAPLSEKRRVVAGFAIARLVLGFAIMAISVALFTDWLAPAFIALGGYLAGSTAATPLREQDFNQ